MITRREAMLGLSVAAVGSAAPSAFGLFELLRPAPPDGASTDANVDAGSDSIDERLRKALVQLASRANSEEGVPVFLACVNQVVSKNTKGVPELTRLNTEIVTEMRQNAAAWQRLKPNPPASDVAQLIEVLAERDFLAGGPEHKA